MVLAYIKPIEYKRTSCWRLWRIAGDFGGRFAIETVKRETVSCEERELSEVEGKC